MTSQEITDFKIAVGETIKEWFKGSGFSERKLTDTPTDDLQVANKKYVDDSAIPTPVSIANGGTGASSQTAAFDNLAPTTSNGDIIVNNGTDNIRVPIGDYLPNTYPAFGTYVTNVITADPNLGWTFGGGTTSKRGNFTFNATATTSQMTIGLGGRISSGLVQWDSGIDFKIAYTFITAIASTGATPAGADDRWMWHGFSTTVGSPQTTADITDTSVRRVCFTHYNGKVYAVTCNGTSTTSTEVVGTDAASKKHYMIGFTPSSCTFYINGTLVATITTTIPSSSNTISLGFELYYGSGSSSEIGVSPITISETLS